MSLLVRLNKPNTEAGREWLVGHPGADVRTWSHGADVNLSPRSGQESVSGAQWQFQKLLETGNKGVEFAVSCTRRFVNALAAWRYKLSLAAKAPTERPHEWSGDVVLRMLTARGGDNAALPAGSWEEHIMRGALVSVAPLLGGGESVNLSYSIKALHVEPYRCGRSGLLSGLVSVWRPPVAKLYIPPDGIEAGDVTPISGGGVVTVPWSGVLPVALSNAYTFDVELWAVSDDPGEGSQQVVVVNHSGHVFHSMLFSDLAFDADVYTADPGWMHSPAQMPGYHYSNGLNATVNQLLDNPEGQAALHLTVVRGADSVGDYVLVTWVPEGAPFTGPMRYELRSRILHNGYDFVTVGGVTTYLPRQTVEWRGYVLEERLLTLPGGVGVVLDRLYSAVQL